MCMNLWKQVCRLFLKTFTFLFYSEGKHSEYQSFEKRLCVWIQQKFSGISISIHNTKILISSLYKIYKKILTGFVGEME